MADSETDGINEELCRIRGDAIGDTVYSERYVLRVLIKLSELTDDTWDSDTEQMACSLWDMATERDIVFFLMSNDFYNISCQVLRSVSNARCIEIVAGILGNMCCVEEARAALAEHNACLVVLNLITSEDSLVLIQVVRLLNSCLWFLRKEDTPGTRANTPTLESEENGDTKVEPWLSATIPHKEIILKHLGFFLSSSVNEELLCASLELLDTILAIPALKLAEGAASSIELADGLAECLRQLLKGARVGDSVTGNKKLWRAVHVWLGLVGHVASCQQGRMNLGCNGDTLTKCFTKLLVLLTSAEALKTQEPEFATYCLCVLETLPQIQVSVPVLARLIAVLYQLDEDIEELTREMEDSLEVRNLLHRGMQLVKRFLETSDDLPGLLQALPQTHIPFLVGIAQCDSLLRNRLESALLQIRTNGLIQ